MWRNDLCPALLISKTGLMIIYKHNQTNSIFILKIIVVILLLLFLFASLTNFRTKIEETGDMRVMHSKARQSHPPDVWNSKAVQGSSQRTEIPFI